MSPLALFLLALSPAVVVGQPRGSATPRPLNHIMVIWGENTPYATARAQPYLRSLAEGYAEFTNYAAITHPSMPNYMTLSSGAPQVTSNVGCTSLAVTNLADLLESASLDWRGYNESMVTPCVDNGSYLSKHDFFVNYTSVRTNPDRLAKVRGFTSTDPASYSELLAADPPELVFVTPNMCNDGHDCGIARFDQWLAGTTGDRFFQDMLTSDYYNDGAIFVAFDEDGGPAGSINHVYSVAISARARPGFNDGAAYTHYSMLRTIEDNFGLPTMTANDAAASNMLGAFWPLPVEGTNWEVF